MTDNRQGDPLALPVLPRATVQHVAEPTVQPRLARCVVMFRLNRFVVDVRKMAAQAYHLLHEPALSLDHEIPKAFIPELVTVGNRTGNTAAVGLDRVFLYLVRVKRRQLTVPIHCLWLVLSVGYAHMTPL